MTGANVNTAAGAVIKPAFINADATSLPFADRTFAFTFGSPPYCDARTYGIGAQRDCVEWVTWMLRVVAELQRVTIGPVCLVAAGVTRDRNYWPACEGLMWEWWKLGGDCQLYRPCFWHRVGIPGSGGKDWFRADVEFVMCFKRPGALAWSDNVAMGHEPKFAVGGAPSHRTASGSRVGDSARDAFGFGGRRVRTRAGTKTFHLADDDFESAGKPMYRRGRNGDRQNGKMMEMIASAGAEPKVASMLENGFPPGAKLHTKATAEGMRVQAYIPPTKANPGNLVKVIVGGGVMGHPLSHENEAPFPEKLAEWFIKSLAPVGGLVLDPFSGSGTTACVANRLGRIGIGCDLRFSQCELGRKRARTPYATRVRKQKAGTEERGLFSTLEVA